MKSIILFIKGFVMGIANIIPGVSGGTLALILGIYERFIDSISHFFTHFKKNIKFLIPVVLGMGTAILSMSNVIDYSYKNYPIATTLFFMGLVVGGIPLLYSKVNGKNDDKRIISILALILSFALVIFMSIAPILFNYSDISLTNMNLLGYIILLIVGIIASATMVIPGISGSLVLMLLGYYYPIIGLIKHIFNINNILILGVFGMGILFGIVLVAKLIEFLFNKYATSTYYGVLGFIFASVIAIPISTFINNKVVFNVLEILISIVLFILGCLLSYKLGEKEC